MEPTDSSLWHAIPRQKEISDLEGSCATHQRSVMIAHAACLDADQPHERTWPLQANARPIDQSWQGCGLPTQKLLFVALPQSLPFG